MAVDKERVKILLGHITDHTRVAHLAGCDVSYISQLMADPEFAEDVALARLAQEERTMGMDNKADELENTLLDKLKKAVPMMFKPAEILRAYEVLNKAHRRAPMGTIGNNGAGAAVVQITLPPRAALRFKMDGAGEVIEVEGRPLVTMPSSDLMRQLSERGSVHGQELKALSDRLDTYSEVAGLAGEAGSAEATRRGG